MTPEEERKLMGRAPRKNASRVRIRDGGDGWRWATYEFEGCKHTRDALYPPRRTPPPQRKLHCYECAKNAQD